MSEAIAFEKFEARSEELQNNMDLTDTTLEHNRVLFKQKVAREFDSALDAMDKGIDDVRKEVIEAIRAERKVQIEEARKENEELAAQLAQA